MVSARAFEYVFGYYLTIRKFSVRTDDGIEFPYLKLKFDNEESFKAFGLKAVRMCYELDGPYKKTLEGSEPHCSRRPIIPHYQFWNYTVEHFEEFDEALLNCFRCRMYWYKDEDVRHSSVISSPAEFEFYSDLADKINVLIQAEPATADNVDELAKVMNEGMSRITNDLKQMERDIISQHRH